MSTRTSLASVELEDLSRQETSSTAGLQASLPPTDRGAGAYGFLFAAFVLEVFVWGYSYSFATILVYLQTHAPWDQQSIAAITAIGTTQTGIQFILPTPTVFLFSRYPEWVKTALWCAVVLSVGSQLLASFVNQKVIYLILLQGVVAGTANAVLFTPVFMWLGQWWVTRRSTAYGVICSGIGFGGFAFPFLMNAILESPGGFPWLCRAWAGITAVVFSLAVYFIKPRLPVTVPEKGRRIWLPVDWAALRNPIFLLMGLSSFLAGCSYLPVALYLPTYAASLTSSVTQQNLVLAIFSLGSALGSTLSGALSDRTVGGTVLLCGICGAVLSLSAWGLAESLAVLYVFAVLFSLTGQMVSAWGGAARAVAGSNPNTSMLLFCLFSAIRGIAAICIPFLTELLYAPAKAGHGSEWGSFGFQKLIVFVGVTAFFSGLGGLAIQVVLMRRKK